MLLKKFTEDLGVGGNLKMASSDSKSIIFYFFLFQFDFLDYDGKEKQIDTQDMQMMTKRGGDPGLRRVGLGMIRLLKHREREDHVRC